MICVNIQIRKVNSKLVLEFVEVEEHSSGQRSPWHVHFFSTTRTYCHDQNNTKHPLMHRCRLGGIAYYLKKYNDPSSTIVHWKQIVPLMSTTNRL